MTAIPMKVSTFGFEILYTEFFAQAQEIASGTLYVFANSVAASTAVERAVTECTDEKGAPRSSCESLRPSVFLEEQQRNVRETQRRSRIVARELLGDSCRARRSISSAGSLASRASEDAWGGVSAILQQPAEQEHVTASSNRTTSKTTSRNYHLRDCPAVTSRSDAYEVSTLGPPGAEGSGRKEKLSRFVHQIVRDHERAERRYRLREGANN
eukprot:GSA25T00001218001.1